MKMKSMVQLLAPLAITVVFYIVWCIFWGILSGLDVIHYKDNPFNIFDFDYNAGYATSFWIINVILIIIAEIFVTNIPDDEF